MAFDAGTIEAQLDIDRTPFREGLIAARKEAEAFEKRKIKLKVDVDKNFAGQIQRAINETQGKTGRGIRIPVDIDKSTVDDFKDQLDRIGDNTETTARRSGNRVARAFLNPLVMQLGLIPGIAAAASAAGALALGALPLAIGAIGIAALKSNETVKLAYSSMWNDIKDEAGEIAAPLEDTFVDISQHIFSTWRQLRPELSSMFKDAAPLITEFADGVLGAAEQAVPRFRTAIQVSGPAMRGFANLIEDVGVGVGDMAIEMSKSSVSMGRSADLVGDLIAGLLRDIGTLVAQFSGFWANIGPQFNATVNQLMASVLKFTEGGLQGLGSSLQMTLSIVQAFLSVLGPFAEAFGQVGGNILGMIGSWKLLGGAIGVVAKAWNLLKPSTWVSKMSGVSKAVAEAAQNFGGLITKVSGSEEAGNRFTAVTTKIWSGVSKAASSLPLLGTAFLTGKAIIDSYYPSADELAQKIQQGGKAAEEASGQMYSVAEGYNRGSLFAQTFAATSEDVRAAIQKQREGMTELERTQADAAKAQRDYDYAVDKFGKNSPQAIQASENLAVATDQVTDAQEAAADATKDHTDKIIEQTNLMLGAVGARLNYQSALLDLEQAQRAATDAVKEHGKGSLEARNADIQYQQSLLSVVNSIGARVKAENASKGETESTRLSTIAMRMEIARLAVEAGSNLPPALAEMASGLTTAELAAMGVKRGVDAAGNAIYVLPPGKTLSFPNNADQAKAQVQGLANAVYSLPTAKWFTYYVDTVVKNAPPRNVGADNANTTPGLFGGGRATGGRVQRGKAYWTGERGLPELFFPDQDGFVLNGRDSAKIADAASKPNTRTGGSPVLGGDGSNQGGFEDLVAAVAAAVYDAFNGASVMISGNGAAKLVNQTNLRNRGR